MASVVRTISKNAVLFGEYPIWDNRREQLIFTDCFSKSISIFDPITQEITSTKVIPLFEDNNYKYTVFSMPYASSTNKFLVTLSSGKVVEFDLEKNEVTRVLYDCKNPSINYMGGKCDAKGRFWTGAGKIEDLVTIKMAEDKGEIFKLWKAERSDGTLDSRNECGNFDLPCGLGFNQGMTKLFWSDFTRRIIYIFDFDLTNEKLGNRRIFFDYKEHAELEDSFPDGLCIDDNGNVWVACWKGGCIIKIDGSTGKLMEKVPIPVKNTTSVCFGGTSYDRLYVTTTSIEMDESPVIGEPDAGKVFEITYPKDNSFKGFQECFVGL